MMRRDVMHPAVSLERIASSAANKAWLSSLECSSKNRPEDKPTPEKKYPRLCFVVVVEQMCLARAVSTAAAKLRANSFLRNRRRRRNDDSRILSRTPATSSGLHSSSPRRAKSAMSRVDKAFCHSFFSSSLPVGYFQMLLLFI